MALDTVIDKAQFEAALTASADAIREKTGDTALIEWLSDKGFADAIATIEAGGMKFTTGEITPSSDVLSLTIEHGLGVTPKFAILRLKYSYSFSTTANTVLLVCFEESGSLNGGQSGVTDLLVTYGKRYSAGSYIASLHGANSEYITVDSNSITTTPKSYGNPGFEYYYFAGKPYRWMAIA